MQTAVAVAAARPKKKRRRTGDASDSVLREAPGPFHVVAIDPALQTLAFGLIECVGETCEDAFMASLQDESPDEADREHEPARVREIRSRAVRVGIGESKGGVSVGELFELIVCMWRRRRVQRMLERADAIIVEQQEHSQNARLKAVQYALMALAADHAHAQAYLCDRRVPVLSAPANAVKAFFPSVFPRLPRAPKGSSVQERRRVQQRQYTQDKRQAVRHAWGAMPARTRAETPRQKRDDVCDTYFIALFAYYRHMMCKKRAERDLAVKPLTDLELEEWYVEKDAAEQALGVGDLTEAIELEDPDEDTW